MPWEEIRKKKPRLYRKGLYHECGIGWAPLIQDLSSKIESILLRMAEDGNPDCLEMYCVQVKQKYGTLRFYMNYVTEQLTQLIRQAEALSSQTCEICGNAGNMISERSNFRVRCDACKQGEKECKVSAHKKSQQVLTALSQKGL